MDEQNHQAIPLNELVGQFHARRYVFMGYILRFNLYWDIAEEIFQEACLKFLTITGSFSSYPPAAKYFHKIIFSLAVERQKKQKRLLVMEKPPEMICERESDWQRNILLEEQYQAICCLSLKEQRLLNIHLLPELKVQEKSKLMQLPLSTYRYKVGRIITTLRKRLAPKTGFKQIGGN